MTTPDPRLTFTCRICREQHTAAMAYASAAPHATAAIPPDRHADRIDFSKDQCVIDASRFYLRGRILIPLHGLTQPFVWGCWAEVSPRDFMRTHELWQAQGREAQPPFPGWLDTTLSLYGDTLNLSVDVQTQVVGRRPHFTIIDSGHPIAREQREGITIERLHRIAEHVLHPGL